MEREEITPEEAFAKLSILSQRAEIKLRVLAETIVRTGEY